MESSDLAIDEIIIDLMIHNEIIFQFKKMKTIHKYKTPIYLLIVIIITAGFMYKQNSTLAIGTKAPELAFNNPEGKEITVYVNPSNHREAVLETGLSGVDFFTFCICLFPLVGLVLLYYSVSQTFSKSNNQ